MFCWSLIALTFIFKSEGLKTDCTQEICELVDHSLRFFILGDFGGLPVWPHYTLAQKLVAKKIAKMGTKFRTHFQIELGDNFYTEGVKDVDDERFNETFKDIYDGSAAMFRPWYILAGNHDHYGNVSAQVDYSQVESRWKFPSLYYKFQYQLTDRTLIEFIMIDTIVLCGNNRDLEFASFWEVLTADSHQPCCPRDLRATQKHWQWLEKTLNESKADYLFVAGHFPVWSISAHGPTNCLVERLEPMLHKYKVSAYLSGHDHTLQHLRYENASWSVDYIVSGAASRSDHSTDHMDDVPPGSLHYHYPTGWNPLSELGFTKGGYVYASVGSSQANFIFYNGEGERKYSFSMAKRNQ